MLQVISLLTRHGLTAVGTGLVADGYVDAATAEMMVGSGVAAVGILWSIAQKKGFVK
jgi:hypothetical protein